MIRTEQKGVPLICAENLTNAGGTVHGFSTRLGGVSAGIFSSLNLSSTRGDDPACVRENYARLCATVGADPHRLVLTKQVHECTIRTVTEKDIQADVCAPVQQECDALITRTKGLGLVVFTADCIPILLYDPVRKAVAAVHAGWRGTAGNIGGKTVERMQREFGTCPADLIAAIGPGISQCCFETDEDVPRAMETNLGDVVQPFLQTGPGTKFHVDLKGIHTALLRQAGVTNIEVCPDCTACCPDLYWSHRITKGRRGNQGAIILLRPV